MHFRISLKVIGHKGNFCILFYEFGHNTLFTFGYYIVGKYAYPDTAIVFIAESLNHSFKVCSKMLIQSL